MKRKVSNRGGNYIGFFASYKCNNAIQWESFNFENVFAMCLERDPFVIEYEDQAKTVGKQTIDFRSTQRNGSNRYYNVKPYDKILREDNLSKYEFWQKLSHKHGMQFWLVTDFPPFEEDKKRLNCDHIFVLPSQIERANLSLLTQFAAPCFYSKDTIARVRNILSNEDKMTINELVSHLPEDEHIYPLLRIYNMIYHQVLKTDETKPITLESYIELSSGVKEIITPNQYVHQGNLLPILAIKKYRYLYG